MIRHAAPVRFDRLAESGRTRPLRVVVETSDGEEHDAFLKASGRQELGVEGLANEALAACLAGDLGLPINEPFLVDLDPAWIGSSRWADASDAARQRVGRFCLESCGSAVEDLVRQDNTLKSSSRGMALAIFAFDAYIENDDRTVRNSNCLVKGDEFRIIDHELAFRLRHKLFPRPEPWIIGNLRRHTDQDGHIFATKLKGRKDLDFGPIRRAWSDLPDERLHGYASALQAEWAGASEAISAALTHIISVRDRVEDCLAELQRALR